MIETEYPGRTFGNIRKRFNLCSDQPEVFVPLIASWIKEAG